MTKKEMERFSAMQAKVANASRTSKNVVDLGYGKKYDRILNILVNFETEGLYKTKIKGTLATMTEAICEVLDYEAREPAQELSTDSEEPTLAGL